MILFDSNIFIYTETREDARHEQARTLRDMALAGQIDACISPQVLSEFFSVVTYAGRGGPENPMSISEASELIRKYNESEDIAIIYPGHQTIGLMLDLLDAHPVSGARIHDLRIAATMLENGVTEIATYDTHVFARLPGITVLNPKNIILTQSKPKAKNENTSTH